ncbi:hypothetical protein K6Y31_20210 [Motilimonas cestriensis]|uniref:Thioredoxin-like fold domain-containing protein n=1 Tax=Motilimonas cestriensis TaxID=2742685 RepID=A0ABS8WFZ6_9GAMM|nr:hypothetical protein [Motilimonas cestriensis]MCE2597102.1 hypothetical protein [Motilimonas cestriensis]
MKKTIINAAVFTSVFMAATAPVMAENVKISLNDLFANVLTTDEDKAQSTQPDISKKVSPINSIETVNNLAAWQEGNATDPNKILYVTIDPRCPYCKLAYENLRPYIKKGMTVRWISTQALGRSPKAAKLSAAVLRGGPDAHSIMTHTLSHLTNNAPVTQKEQEQMKQSLDYLFASFKENPSVGSPGVPVAYYVNKTGDFKMLKDLSEVSVVKQVVADGNF